MPAITFNDEFVYPVAPHRLFHGLFVDAHNLMPKIMPVVKSVDFVSGDGGPGSVQQVNFVDGYQMKYVKNRLDFKDKENCAINYTAIESDSFGDRIDYIISEVKFDAASDGGSKCTIKTTVCPKGDVVLDDKTLKSGKQGHMEQYKVVIAHLIENPHLYA
ncbi:hypothetical protein MKW94_005626 [Papaver nudicaule]|uniref:Bet v I/Major latex protein domain-containing protein n=1 Tax=Papaver nudicaule TaxID=74823 RepID=A0AA41VWW4_PAPNU|nr:hypothetical protein [Papaver nudicaule]